jgi:uncharacterized protein
VTRFPLRRLRLRPGEEHRDAVEIEIGPFELGGALYVVTPPQPTAELLVSRATSGLVLELRFDVRLHGPCMRCLADAVTDVAIEAREYHADEPGDDAELTSEYVVEDQIELSGWARDLIGLSLPEQLLCRPDCAGLCPVCGKDLNVEPHQHEDDRIDSRWEALIDLRDSL